MNKDMNFENMNIEETKKEAEQGDARAQFNLGFMYADGRGVAQNDTEAVKWYRLAADQGHATAKQSLKGMPGEFI